jgi:hypothetical protein
MLATEGNTPMQWLSALIVGLALAGCANGLARRQAELIHWVGKPETVLVAALGAPNRTYEASGMKFLTYEDRQTDYIPGGPYFGPGPFWYGGWGGFPPEVITWTCDTTFTITNGTVQAFSLRGGGCND